MKEYINGILYVNGYATDSYGRPRTMSNGYSSEDEYEAKLAYEEAFAEKNKNLEQEETVVAEYVVTYEDEKQDNNPSYSNQEESKKITTKKQITAEYKALQSELVEVDNYIYLNGQYLKIEYFEGKKFVGGYATNELGQPICKENGYSDEDELYSKQIYKTAKQNYLASIQSF